MLTLRSIYGADPLSEIRRLQQDMNRVFQAAAPARSMAFPAMNVYAGQDGVAITAELPSVALDDLDITAHRDTVTLKGERKALSEGLRGRRPRRRLLRSVCSLNQSKVRRAAVPKQIVRLTVLCNVMLS